MNSMHDYIKAGWIVRAGVPVAESITNAKLALNAIGVGDDLFWDTDHDCPSFRGDQIDDCRKVVDWNLRIEAVYGQSFGYIPTQDAVLAAVVSIAQDNERNLFATTPTEVC